MNRRIGIAVVAVISVVLAIFGGLVVHRAPLQTTTSTQIFDFTQGVPAGWITYDSKRIRASNVVAEDNAVSLKTRPYGTEWRGASLVWPTAFTYGDVTVTMRSDKGRNTKALLMLWPEGAWPPEIDFLEMGGLNNWDRQKIALTAHYDPDNKMIHRSIIADMTTWSTVEVIWSPTQITFSDSRAGSTTVTTIPNPGIDVPMKVQLAYWPTHKQAGDPWPTSASRMQVSQVTIAGA